MESTRDDQSTKNLNKERDERPIVKSFDMFDTLVGRRCVDPHGVFLEMERRSGIPNLASARIAAERSVASASYGLDDIYRSLGSTFGVSDEALESLKKLELEIEWEMLFPIAQTCSFFGLEDLVVSDMYLPDEFLRKVLTDRCRLNPKRLYLSSDGKRSGRVWNAISQNYRISEHFGDNLITDIQSASRAGIVARHVQVSAQSQVESAVRDAGFPALSQLVREARLTTWHHSPSLRDVQMLQIQLNFPLLFLGCLNLVVEAKRRGWQRILFSGRDGFLWCGLYQLLFPRLADAPPCDYFYTSRIARMRPSEAYLRYFCALCKGERCVVVDLVGTGWSTTRLIEQAEVSNVDSFLIHWLDLPALVERYEALAPLRTKVSPLAIVRRTANADDNEVLEELNRAPHPMVVDVEWTSAGFRPVLAPDDLSLATRRHLRLHHEAFNAAASLAADLAPAALSEMAKRPVTRLMEALYGAMAGHLPKISQFRAGKSRDEALVFATLQARMNAAADHDP